MSQDVRSSIDQFAPSARARIDAALDRYTTFGADCPPDLAKAVRYSLLAPGKRMRPLMTWLACEAAGGDPVTSLPAGCAVEMIHAYSLIHDDLPAMDDDDLRRGRPTNHKVFGEGMAVLAGDALLTLAFQVLATEVRPPEIAALCCAALAKAAGVAGMVGGQADDLKAETDPVGLEGLESIHRRKTAAMFNVSLKLGGLVAGANAERLAQLDHFGWSLGLAFQIADDLLDVKGDEGILGKRVGKDSQRGKTTFPGLVGIEESTRRAHALAETACNSLATWGPAADKLCGLAWYVVERDR